MFLSVPQPVTKNQILNLFDAIFVAVVIMIRKPKRPNSFCFCKIKKKSIKTNKFGFGFLVTRCCKERNNKE